MFNSSNTPKANKKLGQHYLNNQDTIKKICHDFVKDASAIIEIGPGPATLSKELASSKLPFYMIEKDERFLEILNQLIPRPTIINADALELDFSTEIFDKNLNIDNFWLVSNLPYNVGVPIMLKSIKE